MNIRHELWYLVAGGILDSVLSLMQSVSDSNWNAYQLLWERKAFHGQVYRQSFLDLGYVPNVNVVHTLLQYCTDAEYAPVLSYEANRPTNPDSDGTTLTCDPAPEGYTRYVFRLDGKRFTEMGPLADHNQPAAGTYVIALVEDASGRVGLPSKFLTIT